MNKFLLIWKKEKKNIIDLVQAFFSQNVRKEGVVVFVI